MEGVLPERRDLAAEGRLRRAAALVARRRPEADGRRPALARARSRARGLFDPARCPGLIRDNDAGRADNALRIWALLTLELWHRTFLDRTGFGATAPQSPTPSRVVDGDRPLRIVHCLWEGEVGGTQRAVYQLVREQLRDPSIEPAALFAQARGPYVEAARELAAPVLELDLSSGHALGELDRSPSRPCGPSTSTTSTRQSRC